MKYAEHFYLDSEAVKEEYIRRHNEIWPEMKALIEESGIYDYTIWLHGTELFACYETDDMEHTLKVLHGSPIKVKWDECMKGLIHFTNGSSPEMLELAFYMK
ncbi:MAG: L-rhamnose mutarotase [Clostridiales bacterium]|nr:L-rhamnose mutarotase [Clostridiales bacterium]